MGAGRVSDTAKNVAAILHRDLIIIPTLAATCAAYSAVSINSDEHHAYEASVLHERTSDLVLVDPLLIATGPRKYLLGGIGDTLAKYYESAPVFARLGELRSLSKLAQSAAVLIHDTLLKESIPALNEYDKNLVGKHFHALVDTIIALGGSVSAFGGVPARASGAHTIHDGLTLIPESKLTTHGAKVAYGVIIQLITEGKNLEVKSLLPFYQSVGLPHTFRQLGIPFNDNTIRIVSDFAVGQKSRYRLAVPDITSSQIADAIVTAERLY
ncbi:MAG: iron-containing alcohol dehydrogenase [Bifidobacterium scardovii]|uniref:iron-containing alcohol dehydrogenase n=1 Tax=Bifidobacterium scardovii TaxID=158787 RepID=UPI001EFA1791|nr:iron-containing alcohol dehydrogenase [Bifidobacterium scardovii]MDU5297135.1 iron-containing alcohol dehydrogenase [Bifidobacterium scardovii]MDU5611535.1 iron-containing alcohol dehydrogenase [Bifidobacterium scardovii]